MKINIKPFQFFFALMAFCFNTLAQSEVDLVKETVSKAEIKAHLSFLASDELKGRETPSPEQEIAARYIRTQLEMYGVKAFDEYPEYLQPVSMQKVTPPTTGEISVGDKKWVIAEDFLMLYGENGNLKGPVVFAGYGQPDELKKAKAAGKIVVVNAGDGVQMSPQSWFMMGQEKRKNAKEAGALALIELYNSPQLPWKILIRYFSGSSISLSEQVESDNNLVHLMLKNANNEQMEVFQDKKITGSINISGKIREAFTTYNVVGYLEGSDAQLKNEYVVYSGHYDHVGVGRADSTGDNIYNGARDNAVGTSTVLLAAKNLGKYPTKRSSLFILFTGEEKGLLGSEWYVDHSPVPLKQIIYCFNSDNAGYNDTSLITIFGLNRTTASQDILDAGEAFGLKVIDDPAPEQNLFDRSDNVSFAAKGIPAPTFSMGLTAFDDEINKYYHQPSDDPQTLDYDYLYKFFQAYVLAARKISNANDRPFWVVGDKYYDAGKKLYGIK